LDSLTLTKLSESDPAKCPNVCGHSYKGKSRKAHLKRHLIYECGVPKKFKCDMCLKTFAYNVALQKHYKTCMKDILIYNYQNSFFNWLDQIKTILLLYHSIFKQTINVVIIKHTYQSNRKKTQLIKFTVIIITLFNCVIIIYDLNLMGNLSKKLDIYCIYSELIFYCSQFMVTCSLIIFQIIFCSNVKLYSYLWLIISYIYMHVYGNSISMAIIVPSSDFIVVRS